MAGLSRREMLTAVCSAGASCLLGRSSPAQQPAGGPAAAALLTPAARQAARRGLEYLRGQQVDEGWIRFRGSAEPVAITALAGLAFLASGSTPGRGPFGESIDRCIDYLLASSDASGFLHAPGSGNRPMYGHGFGTLFLAEVYGMAQQDRLRERLAAAIQLICQSQNPDGGWRYQPRPDDADVSVSSAQLIALRAARNAGLNVPPEVVRSAVDYLVRMQLPNGGFRYMQPVDEAAFPRSAAAVMALYSAGMHGSAEVARGLDYVQGFVPDGSSVRGALDADPKVRYLFYGHYYAAQAMWQAGPQRWSRWYPAVRDMLVAAQRQRDDGAWASEISPEYATAMACFILNIPLGSVPVLQR